MRNVDGTTKWDGPYIKGKLPQDPWGGDYSIAYPGKNGDFDVVSRGSDKKTGGTGDAADIYSTDLNAE